MRKSFQYKAKLSPAAADAARGQLAVCCELYNAALQERRDHWQQRGVAVTAVQQKLQLPSIKQVRPDLAVVGSQVLLVGVGPLLNEADGWRGHRHTPDEVILSPETTAHATTIAWTPGAAGPHPGNSRKPACVPRSA
ncbi:MAG: hypothetical protein U0974_11895 [Gemmatimonadales bacterium]|nr:hypothetical protein [Gemmatimonadales bacterium]